MAQSSFPWSTEIPSGDGADTYSAAQVREVWRSNSTTDRHASESILSGLLNELVVTGSASPLSVASGIAFCNGIKHTSDAAVSVTVPTPNGGTTKHRVVLQAIWGSTQAARIALISSADGINTYPTLTQSDNSRWEVPLYGVTIDILGAITLEDQRDPCHFATALVRARKGGSSSDWSSAGSTNYTPGGVIRQMGMTTLTWDDEDESETKQITFPIAFAQKPIVRVQIYNEGIAQNYKLIASKESCTASTLTIRGQRADSSSDLTTTCNVAWIATGVGPV